MFADGPIVTHQDIHQKQVDRYEGLKGQLQGTFDRMRRLANTLPPEARILLLRQVESADVTQEALMNEFGRKP